MKSTTRSLVLALDLELFFSCGRSWIALLVASTALADSRAAQGYPSATLYVDREVFAADGASFDRYGSGIDIAGNRAVIGAYNDADLGGGSGSVYVDDRNLGGAGAWGTVTKLYALGELPGDFFGSSVAIDGGLIAVGAWGVDDPFAGNDSGAAYLFDNTSLTQLVEFTPPVPQFNSLFGYSIGVDDASGLVVVGDPGWDNLPANDVGRAYLYSASGGPALFSVGGAGLASDLFGYAVAISDGIVVVGAPGEGSTIPGNGIGAVYVYDGTAATFLHKLVPADGQLDDDFGLSVACDAAVGVIAVGAPRHNAGFGADVGAVYLFDLTSGAQIAKFVEPLGLSFGVSVALQGEVLLASLPSPVGGPSGLIYQYEWELGYAVATFRQSLTPRSEGLGTGLALDGFTAFTADFLNGSGVASQTGTAWTLTASKLALSTDVTVGSASATTTHFTLRPGTPGKLGAVVASAFDGVPIPFVLVGVGMFDATGQLVFTVPPQGALVANHSVTILGGGFSRNGPLVLTSTVDLSFVP